MRNLLGLLLALPLLAGPAPAGQAATITWKGKRLQAASLPADLPAEAKRALEAWLPWADEHGYRCDFDGQARVLLVGSERGTGPEGRLRAIGRTETWFDQLLPPAARPADAQAPAPKAPPAQGGIPEDPEAPPPGAPKTSEAPASTTWSTSWGAGNAPADSVTAVLFVLRDEADLAALLARLVAAHPYLKDWSAIARKQTGFVLEEPLCGAYVEAARGQQEWDPEHELVNRAGQVLLLRRFGQLPFWLQQAVGWEAECAFDGALYCFPYRDQFVFATEHTGWPSELKLEFKDRADRPLAVEELASWQRGRFEASAAHKAWGFVHHAARATPAKLAPALVELARFRIEHDRRSTGPGSWERIPGYEVPAAEQRRILEAHLGADVFDAASRAFRAGLGGAKAPAKSGMQR